MLKHAKAANGALVAGQMMMWMPRLPSSSPSCARRSLRCGQGALLPLPRATLLQHLLATAMPDQTKDATFDSAYLKLRRSNFLWMVMGVGRLLLFFLELMGLAQAALLRMMTRWRRARFSMLETLP